ncbi:MAG: polysaccharide biosynthesis C-terminal domain-containing protein [Flavobacteriales bacterium]|jgi:O-antigen/teichoic acid export membrane protein|nr:polysaccharide biosynthesis C-terminal domain-containing protein [Flavobacteriales bacterium]MBK6754278.1 polysaccharide biosynthesis C-terminal domain-containing protein [Flavobacteriales bacterium]MBK7085993.1 polysaccharide biosynthesis C-terminal domain-containing protein [Flavobacteriales bacterium]MBK7269646.1 polysaccharide biosynthesis C-terminal domain-containing protein [Flavobacteriales bacterium]MBK9074668.1 polysaccharide biosynthesis C-terminal domain-containing protein [Flavob
MIKPVIGSVLARVWTTLANLLVFMVAGHALGAEGLGAISLIVLGITLVQLLNNVVGGGALVHLMPRAPLGALLRPAYAWAVITVFVAAAVSLLPLVPEGLALHVVILAFMQSLYSIHLNVLVGRKRFRAYNWIVAAHAALLLAMFLLLLRSPGPRDVVSYVWASYVAFGATLLLSTLAIFLSPQPVTPQAEPGLLRRMVRQGLQIQSANAMQLLNYRLAYYLIEHFRGLAPLGVYSVATQLAEGAWLVPRSLGLVLYGSVSNEAAAARQRSLTLTVFKVAVISAAGAMIIALLLPDALFAWLFGKEVQGLRPILLVLAPGIVAMAASQAYSHYFSGVGANKHNAIGSGVGLMITAVFGVFMVSHHGLLGAAATASLAYGANAIYQGWVFNRLTGARLADLKPTEADVERIRSAWSRM